MFEHGTLYELHTDLGTQRLVVQHERVIRTSFILDWLRGATLDQLWHEIETRGWRAAAIRAATPADCALRLVRDNEAAS